MLRTIYLSGRITGSENYIEMFNKAESLLEGDWNVINPVKLGECLAAKMKKTPSYYQYFKFDIKHLFKADAIYMLKGWEQSKGATAEHAIAVAINLPIHYEG